MLRLINEKIQYCPHHCMPRRGRSSWWIATFQYTLATSNLTIKVPWPRVNAINESINWNILNCKWRLRGCHHLHFALLEMKGPKWDATSQADYSWGSHQNDLCAATEMVALEKDLPPYQQRLHSASRSQSPKGVVKNCACFKKLIVRTPRRGQILSENHPLCQKSHMLQLIRRDDGATPLGIGLAVMVRTWKLEITGQKLHLQRWT